MYQEKEHIEKEDLGGGPTGRPSNNTRNTTSNQQVKQRKALGSENIPAELLKYGG